jgi:YD repeat-containing protein
MVQETNAIAGVTKLGYDAAGNVTSVQDPEHSTTTCGYDGLSRLLSVTSTIRAECGARWTTTRAGRSRRSGSSRLRAHR